MSGSIPPISQYAFMAYTGTTFHRLRHNRICLSCGYYEIHYIYLQDNQAT